jgi:hypothetical protein
MYVQYSTRATAVAFPLCIKRRCCSLIIKGNYTVYHWGRCVLGRGGGLKEKPKAGVLVSKIS